MQCVLLHYVEGIRWVLQWHTFIYSKTHWASPSSGIGESHERIDISSTGTASCYNRGMYNWKILWRHNIKTSNRASDISRKKAKSRGIFRGKFVEKSTDFAGFSREKSQNSRKNRLILRDFHGRKVKFRRIFRGKFLEKAADSTGNVFGNISGGFRGNTWISRVRDRAKYQKPCSNKFLSKGKMYSNPYNLFIHEVGLGDKKNENWTRLKILNLNLILTYNRYSCTLYIHKYTDR